YRKHMQAPTSFSLVAVLVGIVALAIALGVTIGAPILAVPFILIGIGVFLVWRGKQRAGTTASGSYGAERERVPSTAEAAADPVADSGVADATTSASDARHGADAERV